MVAFPPELPPGFSLSPDTRIIALFIPNRPIFPGFKAQIFVKHPSVLKELREILTSKDPYVGTFLIKDDSNSALETENLTGNDLMDKIYTTGTFTQIMDTDENSVTLYGHMRITVTHLEKENDHLICIQAQHLEEKLPTEDHPVVRAMRLELISSLLDVTSKNPLLKNQFELYQKYVPHYKDSQLADFGIVNSSLTKVQYQTVFEEINVFKRLESSLEMVKREGKILQIQASIATEMEAKLQSVQRKSLLKEKIKILQKELGLDTDAKASLISKFEERIKLNEDNIPHHVIQAAQQEFMKLQHLANTSTEFYLTCNYVDWLTSLPWTSSEDCFDICRAEQILDREHYGLMDVKERILEFIAVGKRKGRCEGKVICLFGPPGVGKSSIGRSIARALNREFCRFSVGGLCDTAEIKGHRRTYVGAMPGKPIQFLKSLGTQNPLILIDEVDKLGRGHTGDPAGAMLELLDPGQNKSFLDYFMDVPIDLSKILFVCTANNIETISKPLLDRMEIISLAGYLTADKVKIARGYLQKAAGDECGINPQEIELTDKALLSLIENYCPEAGVRNLQKYIEKIYRKVTLKLVRAASVDAPSPQSTAAVLVDHLNLEHYVGKPPFHAGQTYEETPPGVAIGLAWSENGGSTMFIETSHVEQGLGRGGLTVTGQLGEVMTESAQIAHTVASATLAEKDPQNKFFMDTKVHLHIPAGATPKDGPSAGCAMCMSLISLATKRPVKKGLAMTGEITVTGRILPVGKVREKIMAAQVREKIMAARRNKLRMLIFPAANKSEFVALPENEKTGLEVTFVNDMRQIYDLAFL